MRAAIKPGSEDPGYPITRLALETMGIQPVSVPVERYGLDVEKGRELAPRACLGDLEGRSAGTERRDIEPKPKRGPF